MDRLQSFKDQYNEDNEDPIENIGNPIANKDLKQERKDYQLGGGKASTGSLTTPSIIPDATNNGNEPDHDE